jgi:hypothetical protein
MSILTRSVSEGTICGAALANASGYYSQGIPAEAALSDETPRKIWDKLFGELFASSCPSGTGELSCG